MLPLTVPLVDNFLLDRRRSILERDFLMLNTALTGLQQNQIANELHSLVTVTQAANADANAHRLAAQNKTAADLLGATEFITLQRYTHQNDVTNLPNFWTLMANSKKSQHLNICQWEANRIKEGLGESELQFVVDTPYSNTNRSSLGVKPTLKNRIVVGEALIFAFQR